MKEYLSLASDGSIYREEDHFSLAADGSTYRDPDPKDWRPRQIAYVSLIRPSQEHNRELVNQVRRRLKGGLAFGGFGS